MSRTSAWFRFEFCWFDRTVPCSPRQMRNGFFALNMIAWAMIMMLACKLMA
jgi:hypothetical protein